MKRYCQYLFISLVFFSCANQKEREIEISNSFSFEVVDSLDLKILGDPMLIDINPKADRFAFYDFAGKEFVFTDQSGDVFSRFSKNEDTPDAYGFLMEFPGFINDNQIALAGMKGIFIYDLEGNMVKKMEHPELLGGAGFMSFPGKGIETVMLNDRKYLLSKSVRTRDTFAGEQLFYDTFKALELIDIENDNFVEIVPFEKGSQFLDGNGYFESDYAPALEAFEDKLYVALGGENRLIVYTLSPEGAKLDTIINLQIPGFEKLPITSREEFSDGSITIKGNTPAIRNIHVVDEKIMIHYYGGFPDGTMKELEGMWSSGDKEEAAKFYSKAESEVSQGVLILDKETLKNVGYLDFPNRINKSGFASRGGFLWMQKILDPNEEEDFLRIYKVKVEAK
ncbi:hypothetical protein [Aquiflexum sp.]|uniref:hypothetical protein n=1 Tax=Aquiflexum sp. TaxID=1872584 RepID=UPI003593C74D